MRSILVILTSLIITIWMAPSSVATEKKHGDHGQKNVKDMGMAPCKRDVHLTMKAEHQMGGAMYKAAMKKKHDGEKKAYGGHGSHGKTHMDHDPKMGGAFFMAANQMHHLEGVYHKECGFVVYFYNAFTKPIRANRFRATLSVIKEVNNEEVQFTQSLTVNPKKTFLQAPLKHDLNPPFEVELQIVFPDNKKVEQFNFEIDAHGKTF